MKKKILLGLLTALCITMTQVSAKEFTAEYIELREDEPLPQLEQIKIDGKTGYGSLSSVNGKLYCIGGNVYPVPYDEEILKFFKCVNSQLEYRIFDDYYLARTWGRGAVFSVEWPANSLKIYDKDYNLLTDEDFGGGVYVNDMGYYNGVFYCEYIERYEMVKDEAGNEVYQKVISRLSTKDYGRNKLKERRVVVTSADLENWVETDCDIPRVLDGRAIAEGKSNLTNGELMPIVYEEDTERTFSTTFGDWFVFYHPCGDNGKTDELYFTNDNVYFVKVKYAEKSNESWVTWIYEHPEKDEIVIRGIVSGYMAAPKTEVYNALKEMKNAPYVQYQGSILGFEEPPVIEDDRTLVPMRFLFEQMGAEVDWNQETQTATAKLNNTAVTFSIDNTGASVNHTPVTMEVPARLVNGKTMVPLRFLSENLGYTVTWDGESRIAAIE